MHSGLAPCPVSESKGCREDLHDESSRLLVMDPRQRDFPDRRHDGAFSWKDVRTDRNVDVDRLESDSHSPVQLQYDRPQPKLRAHALLGVRPRWKRRNEHGGATILQRMSKPRDNHRDHQRNKLFHHAVYRMRFDDHEYDARPVGKRRLLHQRQQSGSLTQ